MSVPAEASTGALAPSPAVAQPSISLIDLIPELSAGVSDAQRAAARRVLRAPVVTLAPGRCEPGVLSDDPRANSPVFGVLVTAGLIAREVRLCGRTSTTLYGPGDLLDLRCDEGSSFHGTSELVCAADASVAVLDGLLLAAMRRWPRMFAALLTIAMRQLERADVNAALGRLERVEDRLLAFFWLLADRWGQRRSDGVVIDQPLTHAALGHLIGAQRPTVSLGLRALAQRGLLDRDGDGVWVLSPQSLPLLTAL